MKINSDKLSETIAIDKPYIDRDTLQAWQSIVDTLTKIANVPVALITHLDALTIEVCVASEHPAGNPYLPGDRVQFGTGHFCEAVLKTKHSLLVENALKDRNWQHAPDIDLGLVAYYGIPLLWPDRTPFGTLCIFNCQDYLPSQMVREVMEVLRQNIEASLELTCKSQALFEQQTQTDRITTKLNSALEQTIASLAQAISWRDPYTAGHQRRVADLALQIARKLQLCEIQRRGLYLGAIIHDIGKIYVPAEILNRPGKLTSAEMEMIRSHAVVGAEIVVDIDFPWPVRQMILQHHERMDGSGYPNQLEGNEIILEAQILAVADVVEAMVSHRPYRSALGLEAALEELANGRNTKYSATVVDACLDVFHEDGYQIPNGF